MFFLCVSIPLDTSERMRKEETEYKQRMNFEKTKWQDESLHLLKDFFFYEKRKHKKVYGAETEKYHICLKENIF